MALTMSLDDGEVRETLFVECTGGNYSGDPTPEDQYAGIITGSLGGYGQAGDVVEQCREDKEIATEETDGRHRMTAGRFPKKRARDARGLDDDPR